MYLSVSYVHLPRKVGATSEGFWKILDSELELANVFILYFFFFEKVHSGDKIFVMISKCFF